MTKKTSNVKIRPVDPVFAPAKAGDAGVPVIFARESKNGAPWRDDLVANEQQWLEATGWTAKAGTHVLVPAHDGTLSKVMFGAGDGKGGIPSGPSELLAGRLASALPAGTYHLSDGVEHPRDAAVAWGLGAYRYDAYRSGKKEKDQTSARLQIPATADEASVNNIVEAIWFGRDLINTPASDLGPEELELACRALADKHNAKVNVISGDALIDKNFPLIHAVGRASPRQPRLIDLTWAPDNAKNSTRKTLTIIGKGICFDTGGLDLKPAANMLLMKKDMGGAATVLALAHMIMGHKLDIALRVLIPAAENSVAGNAFRPSDIIRARSGTTVEIGNTDAEGRLVLADALTYADEAKPDAIVTCATLTGAARVALGPDLPALFATDDRFAHAVSEAGLEVGDPVWRMPFWPGYEPLLKSKVADLNNIGSSPLGGAITAALFLNSFVKNTKNYTHVDLYGWRPSPSPLCPTGGDPQSARALFGALQNEVLA